MRINEIITDGKSFDQQTNSLNQFFTEMHGDQSGEFVFGYWGLKGYVSIDAFTCLHVRHIGVQRQ